MASSSAGSILLGGIVPKLVLKEPVSILIKCQEYMHRLFLESKGGVNFLRIVGESDSILEVNIVQVFLQEVGVETEGADKLSILGSSDIHLVHHRLSLVSTISVNVKFVRLKRDIHDVVSCSNVSS